VPRAVQAQKHLLQSVFGVVSMLKQTQEQSQDAWGVTVAQIGEGLLVARHHPLHPLDIRILAPGGGGATD
jgi:hypothetical protein